MTGNGWHRVDPVDVPADGRMRSVVVDGRGVALARCGPKLGALENRCLHQGGPLGEGSIEKGLLRCPWHGYDYDPITGLPPEGFSDGAVAYEVEEREDGVFVQLPNPAELRRTVADAMVETLVAFSIPIRHVLLDNHGLGKIAKEQLAGDFPVWHTSLHNPDWAEYARLCGATGIRVERSDQLDAAMAELFAADGPALLCIEQDAELL